MIDLFIFDMGGVLAESVDIVPEAARRMGLSEDAFRAAMESDVEPFLSGRLEAEEFWERFCSRVGVRAPEDYWGTLFRPVLNPSVGRLVLALRHFGRVVCGTNTIGPHYDILKAAGFYDGFHAVYASHLMGVSKPAPKFWERILEAEGRTAGRAFFIDDMEENIAAARALGIRSHRFTAADSLERTLESSGFPMRGSSAAKGPSGV